jgi:hypothetical protein
MMLQIADDYEYRAKACRTADEPLALSGAAPPASVLGVETANEVPKSGTRLDPIIIGILVSSLHGDGALTLRTFFEPDLLKK